MKRKSKITEDLKHFLESQGIIHVATCGADCMPNVSPKGPLKIDGDTIYFLDLYSKKTRDNLRHNNKIAIEVVDAVNYRGYQLRGTAELIGKGTTFEKYKNIWRHQKNKLIVDRIVRAIQRGMPHDVSEKNLPHPQYLVKVTVSEVIDLVPRQESDHSPKSGRR
ncbi:MAG TPA: pyridoxamine 5'-phosphate oxidase family protein [bacterium]|nr:pyridoxamine 5'-phosphate oxidase family protein [bacterium]